MMRNSWRRRVSLIGASGIAGAILLVILAVLGPTTGLVEPSDGRGTVRAAVGGRILFAHQGEIWMADGGNLTQVTQGGRYWGQPDWSPDGTKIALVGWGDNVTDLFVLDTETTQVNQITQSRRPRLEDSEWVFYPRWAPEGDLIAFTADRRTNYPMLWVSGSDGSRARALTRPGASFDGIETLSWSPDGAHLAVTRFDQATSQIHLVEAGRLTSSQPITAEPGGAFDPAWSPDGRYIAYTARVGRRTSIKIHDTAGQVLTRTLVDGDLVRSPRWAPNGAALAYVGLAGRDFELHVVDVTSDADGNLTAGRPLLLTSRFGVDATSGLSWAP